MTVWSRTGHLRSPIAPIKHILFISIVSAPPSHIALIMIMISWSVISGGGGGGGAWSVSGGTNHLSRQNTKICLGQVFVRRRSVVRCETVWEIFELNYNLFISLSVAAMMQKIFDCWVLFTFDISIISLKSFCMISPTKHNPKNIINILAPAQRTFDSYFEATCSVCRFMPFLKTIIS